MARSRSRLQFLGGLLIAIPFATLALLYLYYPASPHSVLGWIALFAIGIPTWAGLECLGDVVLQHGFFKRLSSPARIALGVPVVLALVTLSWGLIWLGGKIIQCL
jgi:hypothetical protein